MNLSPPEPRLRAATLTDAIADLAYAVDGIADSHAGSPSALALVS